MRQVTRRYADACVGDRENHAPIVAAELNRHLPTARRVLDGVFDEIERELSNAAAIDRHDDRLGRQVNLDRDSRVLGQQLARFARLLDDLTNVDGLLMEIGAPSSARASVSSASSSSVIRFTSCNVSSNDASVSCGKSGLVMARSTPALTTVSGVFNS